MRRRWRAFGDSQLAQPVRGRTLTGTVVDVAEADPPVTAPPDPRSRASVDLYWLPLGAGSGGQCVRASGRLYEALVAARRKRPRLNLYHSALIVGVDDHAYAIEMAPVWA